MPTPANKHLAAVALALLASASTLHAQLRDDLDRLTSEGLYLAACANCHGPGGAGLDRSLVGFEEELPDFSDCDFATREPDADWIAIAHEGGPVRGFSEMMPAFRGALTPGQLARVISYVRTLCTDPNWPRGELNLPRALVTEKAYPEDEWVVEAGADLEGEGAVQSTFVYERRFGPRSQFEVVIPYGWAEVPDPTGSPGARRWVSGLGDAAFAVKHALHHSLESGTIVSMSGEAVLPTGAESKGLGADGATLEVFVTVGQLLPSDAFFQVQSGLELPFYDGGDDEGFARIAVGRSFTEGDWGRTWTPVVELLAKRELAANASTVLDVVPQFQISLNTRQHVLANIGLLVPVTQASGRSVRLLAYVLLDWFDGGFFEGW